MAVTPTYGGSTEHLHLDKPALTDQADIGVINANMDILDGAVYGKVSKETGKGLIKPAVDSLESTDASAPLSANMGRQLNENKVDKTELETLLTIKQLRATIDLPINSNSNYSFDWQKYNELTFIIGTYNNCVKAITVPKSYFAATSSGANIFVYQPPNGTDPMQIYQNGNGSIHVTNTWTNNNLKLKIYG